MIPIYPHLTIVSVTVITGNIIITATGIVAGIGIITDNWN
jgi:hypothetical protein